MQNRDFMLQTVLYRIFLIKFQYPVQHAVFLHARTLAPNMFPLSIFCLEITFHCGSYSRNRVDNSCSGKKLLLVF